MKLGYRSRVSKGALLLLLLGGWSGNAHPDVSLAIVPPFVEKVVPAGSSFTDSLSFTNHGNEPVTVMVDLVDFAVTDAGEVSEEPPGSINSSLARNIRISPLKARVVPNQRVFFRYAVEAPEEFNQLRSMVYFSSFPDIQEGGNQVQVVARMGVPIYVENIKSTAARLEMGAPRWDRPEEQSEHLRLRMPIVNVGERNIRPTGYVHVQSTDGRFDRTFTFNVGMEPVLPGQKRVWEQYFGPVPAGELTADIRVATSSSSTYKASAPIPAAP